MAACAIFSPWTILLHEFCGPKLAVPFERGIASNQGRGGRVVLAGRVGGCELNPEHVLELVRRERLYPGVILHGADDAARRALAFHAARALLCEKPVSERPCDSCRHCSRILLPEEADGKFHPDVVVVERDLRTSTSVDAIKAMLRTVQVAPFEARGQVFLVLSADSMTPAGANALLKSLEEPSLSAPRHFFLLTPSPSDLLPTLRSRCLSVYLGPSVRLELAQDREQLLADLEGAIERYDEKRAGVYLLAIADLLVQALPWTDPRSGAPLVGAASLFLDLSKRTTVGTRRRVLLDLANSIMESKELRMRSISPTRILEAKIAECLTH